MVAHGEDVERGVHPLLQARLGGEHRLVVLQLAGKGEVEGAARHIPVVDGEVFTLFRLDIVLEVFDGRAAAAEGAKARKQVEAAVEHRMQRCDRPARQPRKGAVAAAGGKAFPVAGLGIGGIGGLGGGHEVAAQFLFEGIGERV